MSEEYADICGLTKTERVDNLRPGIESLAKERKEDFDTTLKELRSYYDGYLFAANFNEKKEHRGLEYEIEEAHFS